MSSARVQRRWAVLVVAGVLAAGAGTYALGTDREGQTPDVLVAEPPPAASPAVSCPDEAPPPAEHDLPPAQPGPDGAAPRDSRVVLSLEANCTTIRVGERLLVRITASSDSDTPVVDSTSVDGTTMASSASCVEGADQPTAPEPGTTTQVLEHVYTEAKTDTITVSAGHQCSYYRGSATEELVVTVLPADADAPRTQDIRVEAATPVGLRVGQPWTYEVTVTGNGDQEPFLQEPRYDDSGAGFVIFDCPGPDPSPPPRRKHRFTRTFTHVFGTPGRHEVLLRAESACSAYRGEDELLLVFDVQP